VSTAGYRRQWLNLKKSCWRPSPKRPQRAHALLIILRARIVLDRCLSNIRMGGGVMSSNSVTILELGSSPHRMTNPADEQCRERSSLSTELAKSVREVYVQKRAYDAVKAKKQDTVEPWNVLQAARHSQLAAEQAFNDHINKHGCKT